MSVSKSPSSVSAAAGKTSVSTSHAASSDLDAPAAGKSSKRVSASRKPQKSAEVDAVSLVEGKGRTATIVKTASGDAEAVSGVQPKSSRGRSAASESGSSSGENSTATATPGKPAATARSDHADSPPDDAQVERMIAEAAYYLAEKRNFEPGWEHEDWLSARAAVLAELEGGLR